LSFSRRNWWPTKVAGGRRTDRFQVLGVTTALGANAEPCWFDPLHDAHARHSYFAANDFTFTQPSPASTWRRWSTAASRAHTSWPPTSIRNGGRTTASGCIPSCGRPVPRFRASRIHAKPRRKKGSTRAKHPWCARRRWLESVLAGVHWPRLTACIVTKNCLKSPCNTRRAGCAGSPSLPRDGGIRSGGCQLITGPLTARGGRSRSVPKTRLHAHVVRHAVLRRRCSDLMSVPVNF